MVGGTAIDLQFFQRVRAQILLLCLISEQPVYADGAWHNGQIIDRLRLPEGAEIHGPALLVRLTQPSILTPYQRNCG